MTTKPKLVFYIGFVLFLVGHSSVFFDFEILEFLKPVGTMIAIYAVIQWLRSSRPGDKFRREKGEDGLTYFWNKVAIRLWSGMFFAIMLFSSLTYLLKSILD